ARPLVIAGLPNLSAYQVLSVEQDNQHRLWVYVRDIGLCKYNPSTRALDIVNEGIKNGICLRPDIYGRLWLGTDDGLFEYSVTENRYTRRMSSFARIVQLSIFDNSLNISS